MMFRKYLSTSLVIALTWFVVTPVIADENPTLFIRLGGLKQIREIVSETIDRTSTDPRAARIFEGIKLAPVKESVAQHFCEISNGPCKYEGATMAEAHTGLAITSEQFEIMDTYLRQALSARGIAPTDQAELGRLLSAMKDDVVGK